MINAIIFVAIIVIVIYIFIFRRIKKNRMKTFDSVKEYRENYIDKKGLNHFSSNIKSRNNTGYTLYGDSGNPGTNDYVTKYNSNIDYRESTDSNQIMLDQY